MPQQPRQIHLNAFLMGVGHHEAAWRHPLTDAEGVRSAEHFVELGRTAERGKLDSVFFGDRLTVGPNVQHNMKYVFEPVTLLTAIAGATNHIGLIATSSTTYSDPFTTARKFASLDHISGGRAGWNIVTSAGEDEAANFGLDAIPDHTGRYRRADEFVDVTVALWDSWEDDAVVLDTDSGVFADPDKVHRIDHVGNQFRISGPLTSPRSLQGRPLLVQAGSSASGMDFAARYAEAVFTAQPTLEQGQAFYRDLKARVAAHQRHPDELKVLPGIVPFIASTQAEAHALEREFTDLISPEFALRQLSERLGIDLTGHALDAPLPPLPPVHEFQGNKSRYELIKGLARSGSLTVRELIGQLGGGRGHWTLTGTPEQIADELQLWFEEGAADGFNVMPPYLPGGLTDFVDQVVPILQRRGLFREDYSASTLRGHYGIPHPVNRFTQSGAGVGA